MTIAVTCALPAPPLPVTAALTSLGVWKCTSMPRLAAASAITPPACAVPITVDTFCWENTRSIAITSGLMGVHPVLDGIADRQQPPMQRRIGRSAHHVDVEGDHLPALTALDDGSPQRVSPGSTPITRTSGPFCEHLFEGSLAWWTDATRQRHAPVARLMTLARSAHWPDGSM